MSESPILRPLTDATKLFNDNYQEATGILFTIAQQATALHAHRLEHIHSLQQSLDQQSERNQKVHEKTQQVIQLHNDRRAYLSQLDSEKQDLIEEVLAGTELIRQIKEKKEDVDMSFKNLQHLESELKNRNQHEVPSYKYLIKIFRHLSGVKIVRSDEASLQGFVSKKESEEVLPFKYDKSGDRFQRVNDIWDKILQ